MVTKVVHRILIRVSAFLLLLTFPVAQLIPNGWADSLPLEQDLQSQTATIPVGSSTDFDAEEAGSGSSTDFFSESPLSPASATSLETGLTGYWNFNSPSGGVVSDDSGNGITGTLINGVTPSTDHPHTNYPNSGSLNFDGFNDYVDLGSNVLFDSTQAATISLWTKLDSYALAYPGPITLKTNQATGFEIFFSTNGSYSGINFGSSSNFVRLSTTVLSGSDLLGDWHHIAIVYNGVSRTSPSSYSLYFDGVQQGLSDPGGFAAVPNVNRIGQASTTSTYFDGGIDEVRVYNRALTQAEVQELAALDTTPPTGSVVINNGDNDTNFLTLNLALSAIDMGSGISQMSFSEDNGTWGPLVPFQENYSYTLSVGEGSRTLYVKFYDQAGNESQVYSEEIIVDTILPVISGAIHIPSISSATISWITNEAADAIIEYGTTTSYGTVFSSSEFVTNHSLNITGLQPNTYYYYRLKSKDQAGNEAVSFESAFTTKPALPNNPFPTGSIQISGGSQFTNDQEVTLSLNAFAGRVPGDGNGDGVVDTSDYSGWRNNFGSNLFGDYNQDGVNDAADYVIWRKNSGRVSSPVTEMSFSIDGVNWSDPETYATSISFTLPIGDGNKTVYVRFQNEIGQLSQVYSADIVLDTVAPTGTIEINGGAVSTTSPNVTLALTASDALSGVDAMQFSSDGGTSWTPWEAFSTSKDFTLLQPEGAKEVRFHIRDQAGNITTFIDTIDLEAILSPVDKIFLTSSPYSDVADYELKYRVGDVEKVENIALSMSLNLITRSIKKSDGTFESVDFNIWRVPTLQESFDFGYDENGNLTSKKNATGDDLTYGYDLLNRLTSITSDDGLSVSFGYDGNGNRTSMTDARGLTTYQYDNLNRLKKVISPDMKEISYGYDLVGNLTSLTYPDGTIVIYDYDENNRLEMVTNGLDVTTYQYNDAGDLIEQVLPNGIKTTYDYDEAGRLKLILHEQSDGSLIQRFDYELDANGNRKKVIETIPGGVKTTDYEYDALSHLTKVVYPDGTIETYTYDGAGNRKSMLEQTMAADPGVLTRYTYGIENRLEKLQKIDQATQSVVGEEFFYYGPRGNLVSHVYPDKTILYSYDLRNLLVKVDDGTTVTEFVYDGLGNRISKIVDGVKTDFIVDTHSSSEVIEEYNAAGILSKKYVFGSDRIAIVASAGVGTHYFLTNALRSTTALSNSSAVVTDTYNYGAFGEILNHPDLNVNNFAFAGERMDAETGLIYINGRYYDPATGRFISKAPELNGQVNSQPLNPYIFSAPNPVSVERFKPAQPLDQIFSELEPLQKWLNELGISLPEEFLKSLAMAGLVGATGGSVNPVSFFSDTSSAIDAALAGLLGGLSGFSGDILPSLFPDNVSRFFYSLWKNKDFVSDFINRSGLRSNASIENTAGIIGSIMTNFLAATYDPETQQIILIGSEDSSEPELTIDDLVLAIKMVFGDLFDTLNAVSIGTSPDLQSEVPRLVTYFGGLENTSFGQVMYQIDSILKNLVIGIDAVTGEELDINVPGYEEAVVAYLESEEDNPEKWYLTFYPHASELPMSDDGRSIFFGDMQLDIEAWYWSGGVWGVGDRVIIDDAPIATLLDFFNTNFDLFAAELPVLKRLKQIMNAIALAQFIQDNNIPIDFSWIDDYAVPYAFTPTESLGFPHTRMLWNGEEFVTYSWTEGGVTFRLPPNYIPEVNSVVSSLANTALDARPTVFDMAWQFTHDGNIFNAVPLSLSGEQLTGNLGLIQNDLSFIMPGEVDFAIQRFYDSFTGSNSPFGSAWKIDPFVLNFENPTFYNATFASGTSLKGLREGKVRILDRRSGQEVAFESNFSVQKVNGGYTWTGREPDGTTTFDPVGDVKGTTFTMNPDFTYTWTQTDGSSVKFNVDGKIIEERDQLGNFIQYNYEDGLLTNITDSFARTFTIHYDNLQRIERIDGPLNFSLIYEYDPAGNLATVRNERTGNETHYTYDDSRELVSIEEREGENSSQNAYDVFGRVTEQIDKHGNRFTRVYDLIARTETITNETTGEQIIREYDEQYRLIRETDYQGNERSITYEEDLLQDPYFQSFASDDGSSSVATLNGQILTIDYTGVTSASKGGAEIIFNEPIDFDAKFGSEIRFNYRSPNNNVPEFRLYLYDADGKSNYVYWNSISATWVTTAFNPSNFWTNVDHTKIKKIEFVVEGTGDRDVEIDWSFFNEVIIFDPMAIDSRRTITDAKNHDVTLSYDRNGNLRYVVDSDNLNPSGKTLELSYNGEGKVNWMRDARDVERTYHYTNGNLTEVRENTAGSPVRITKFQYDTFGNLRFVTDPDNHVYEYIYDNLGNLTEIKDGKNKSTQINYDALSRYAGITDALGRDFGIGYNSRDLVTELSNQFGSLDFSYDLQGRFQTFTDANGNQTTFIYDPKTGDLLHVIDPNFGVTSFTYDSFGRIASKTDPSGHTRFFKYDPFGNLTYSGTPNGSPNDPGGGGDPPPAVKDDEEQKKNLSSRVSDDSARFVPEAHVPLVHIPSPTPEDSLLNGYLDGIVGVSSVIALVGLVKFLDQIADRLFNKQSREDVANSHYGTFGNFVDDRLQDPNIVTYKGQLAKEIDLTINGRLIKMIVSLDDLNIFLIQDGSRILEGEFGVDNQGDYVVINGTITHEGTGGLSLVEEIIDGRRTNITFKDLNFDLFKVNPLDGESTIAIGENYNILTGRISGKILNRDLLWEDGDLAFRTLKPFDLNTISSGERADLLQNWNLTDVELDQFIDIIANTEVIDPTAYLISPDFFKDLFYAAAFFEPNIDFPLDLLNTTLDVFSLMFGFNNLFNFSLSALDVLDRVYERVVIEKKSWDDWTTEEVFDHFNINPEEVLREERWAPNFEDWFQELDSSTRAILDTEEIRTYLTGCKTCYVIINQPTVVQNLKSHWLIEKTFSDLRQKLVLRGAHNKIIYDGHSLPQFRIGIDGVHFHDLSTDLGIAIVHIDYDSNAEFTEFVSHLGKFIAECLNQGKSIEVCTQESEPIGVPQ